MRTCLCLLPILLLALGAGGCAGEADSPSQDDDDVAVGTESDLMTSKLAKEYGGAHLLVELTKTGGKLDFDCASGTLSAPNPSLPKPTRKDFLRCPPGRRSD